MRKVFKIGFSFFVLLVSVMSLYAQSDNLNLNITEVNPSGAPNTTNSISTSTVINLPNNINFVGTNFYDVGTSTIDNQWPLQDFTNTNFIQVVGNITINNGEELNITNSHLRLLQNTGITVNNGGVLNITNSWLHGCDFLWKGITVNYGGTLNINGCTIEDAERAVQSTCLGNVVGNYNITNSVFNKNRIHLFLFGISGNTTNHTGTITNTVLQNNGVNLPLNNQTTNVLGTSHGIHINRIGNVTIGPNVTISDAFYGISTTEAGVNLTRSKISNINCEQFNGQGYNCNNYGNQFPGNNLITNPGSRSCAILSRNLLTNNQLILSVAKSTIANCQNGVFAEGRVRVNASSNNFLNISETFGINTTEIQNINAFEQAPGYGFNVRDVHERDILIRSNNFINTEHLVNVSNCNNAAIIVSNNNSSFVSNFMPTPLFNGIWRGFVFRQSDANASPTLWVRGNNIRFVDVGISVVNYFSFLEQNLTLWSNEIRFRPQQTSFRKIGIQMQGCQAKYAIRQNRVYGIPSSTFQPNTIGYNIASSSGFFMNCNLAERTQNAFAFIWTSLGNMSANVMRDYQTGVNIRAGVIGAQGGNNEPRMNSWQGSFTRHFFAEQGTDGSLSNFTLNSVNPLFDIQNIISDIENSQSSPILTNVINSSGPFSAYVNECIDAIYNGEWIPSETNPPIALDTNFVSFIQDKSDTIYSDVFRNDAALQFYRMYQSNSEWNAVSGATALHDSLSMGDVGKIVQAEAAYSFWPALDTLGKPTATLISEYGHLLDALNTAKTVLDSIATTSPWANYAKVMKLQIKKSEHEVSKTLYYLNLQLLDIDSLQTLFLNDSTFNFSYSSSEIRDLEDLALSTPQEFGSLVYRCRTLINSEEYFTIFYLNEYELPSKTIQMKLMNNFETNEINLVLNGSFEEVYSCPTDSNQLDRAKYWSNPIINYGYQQDPDGLLNLNADLSAECSTSTAVNPTLNPILPPAAFDGQNFAGIINKVKNMDEIYQNDTCYFREYIQGKLKQKLINGKKYKVSFEVAINKNANDQVTDKLSMLFTADSLYGYQNLCEFNPQITTNSYFGIPQTWQHFETIYIASGIESFITIGLFLPNYKLELIDNPNFKWQFNPTWFVGYHIDNVKVVCIDPNGCDEISTGENINSQKLTVFPNPTAQQVNLTFSEPFNKALSYTITDLQGRQLLQGSIQNQETVLDISNLSKGIYLLNITDTQGNKWNKKIVKGE